MTTPTEQEVEDMAAVMLRPISFISDRACSVALLRRLRAEVARLTVEVKKMPPAIDKYVADRDRELQRAERAEAEVAALRQDAELTHERICQAIDCRTMGDHAKGWDILRQWLVDVADAALKEGK